MRLSHLCRSTTLLLLGAAIVHAFLPISSFAQQKARDYSELFDKSEVMIPMRDGAKLHTEIYTPKNAAEPLPILF